MQFLAVVHKEPGSAWGVHFPDLPGCHSAADDEKDVLKNAIEALEFWFEDQAFVEPSGLDEIRKMAHQDLEEGAALLCVPYIPRSTRKVSANISMDAATMAAIDAEADRLGLTRSGFIAQASRNEITHPGRAADPAA